MSGEMNFEWVVGGIVLLVTCLILKRLEQRGAFQVLVIAFTLLWSMLAAMHFWGVSAEAVEALLAGTLTRGEVVLAGFWLGFLLAALPSLLLLRFWLRNYKTTFPFVIDRGILWIGSSVVAIVVCCLTLMSLCPFAPPPSKNRTGQVYAVLRTIPARMYLWTAGVTGDDITDRSRRERLLRLVRQLSS